MASLVMFLSFNRVNLVDHSLTIGRKLFRSLCLVRWFTLLSGTNSWSNPFSCSVLILILRLEMNKLSEDVSSFVNCLSLSLIFIGNPGLCGYWLDSSCQGSHPTERGERRSNAREYKQQKNLVANRKMLLSRTNNSQI
ncbi:uncharacterized protein LOC108338908 isoform X1 [Vigna angularis]|uniref:uncharacterized protein LOC108338908 isoform X1 n=1 Tax=Phaseolus angularis TaxID=3914 RepID=UPI0022B32B29|nr:uncharacterized protein LOC108338908 isoform X1 [Vigna angularis]